ncbi:MAG: hypothetical protein M5R42_05385 [Rhodocyclaceae bacterium]|nr:hypothetical protein [Rhodocyclaceae bacterium]
MVKTSGLAQRTIRVLAFRREVAAGTTDEGIIRLHARPLRQKIFHTLTPPFWENSDRSVRKHGVGFLMSIHASAFVRYACRRRAGTRRHSATMAVRENPVDYMIVRQSDAHAWAEVWLKDKAAWSI